MQSSKKAALSPVELVLRVKKNHADAVIPSKQHLTDSGYDVTILSVYKDYGNGVKLYDTGLSIAPDSGYYVDLVARSSLMKQGYMLANCVGIIDNHYRGPLLVGLLKFDPKAADLELPQRVAQLIPRAVIQFDVQVVEDLDDTARGQGSGGTSKSKKAPDTEGNLFKILLHVNGEEHKVFIRPSNSWHSVREQLLHHLARYDDESANSEGDDDQGECEDAATAAERQEFSFVGRTAGRAGDPNSCLSLIDCDYAWLQVAKVHCTWGQPPAIIVRQVERRQLSISSDFMQRIASMKLHRTGSMPLISATK